MTQTSRSLSQPPNTPPNTLPSTPPSIPGLSPLEGITITRTVEVSTEILSNQSRATGRSFSVIRDDNFAAHELEEGDMISQPDQLHTTPLDGAFRDDREAVILDFSRAIDLSHFFNPGTTTSNAIEDNINSYPEQVLGMPQSYLDNLERVPKKQLKATDLCPICVQPFRDNRFPLVVVLPCHNSHWFDLKCLERWLRSKGTCPLDRKDLKKLKKEEVAKPQDSDAANSMRN